jgi:CMP-N,N'-diacetyllegionaminic acid synthase
MHVLITICGRGGSKGIPGKNIRPMNGKPLIGYSIECARRYAELQSSEIVISTDSFEILRAAESFGVTSDYLRPPELATDSAGKVDVIRHVLEYSETKNKVRYQHIIDLDITSPLRTIQDIANAMQQLNQNPQALNIFSVSPAHRNPYFNMVEMNNDGFVELVKRNHNYTTRQSAPRVFDLNASFYIYKRDFFETQNCSVINQYSLAYEMKHVCFDIDHPIDFTIMELIISHNLLGFDL